MGNNSVKTKIMKSMFPPLDTLLNLGAEEKGGCHHVSVSQSIKVVGLETVFTNGERSSRMWI